MPTLLALIKSGDTHVSVYSVNRRQKLPRWLTGIQEKGWVTAEYGMLTKIYYTKEWEEKPRLAK